MFIYLFLNIFTVFFLLLMVLVGVSFLTLLERKILSYVQIRKGPNKVIYLGVLQPFSDAVKLFSKEYFFVYSSFYFLYIFCPLIIMFVSLLSWVVLPLISSIYSFNFGILFLFCCLSVGSYPLMVAGWSSNSIYPLLGAVRSCAQVISYEVSFIIIILSLIFLVESYDLNFLSFFQFDYYMNFYMFPIFFMFFVSMLAELNRMPFDFIEGESELVSGFNTEYFGVGFSLIFMGEYCSILFMSMMFVLFFFCFEISSLFFLFFYLLVIILVIIVRGIVPRFRYDELMFMCWKCFLPLSLGYLFFIIVYKWFLVYVIF